MRAMTMTGFGGLERLRVQRVPRPVIRHPDDVLVRIQAAALNHIDLFVLQGLPKANYAFPHVLGADGSGVVVGVGDAVSTVGPGTRVAINPGISCRRCEACHSGETPLCRRFSVLGEHLEGTMAEYVVVPAANVVEIGNVTCADAAAFSLVTLTAWRMLVTRAALQPGEWVLIWGIGSGVALAALQIAKWRGARVIVTSSSVEKLDRARALGADVGLDHSTGDVVGEVRRLTEVGADVVVDSVGERTWERSLRALRPMGRFVTCGATTGPMVTLDLRRLFWFQWNLLGSTLGTPGEFATIIGLLNSGKLRAVVDSVTPLTEGASAFARLAAGKQFGKLVLEVAP